MTHNPKWVECKQIFFIEIDAVLGRLLTPLLFKPSFGAVDIIHQIRQSLMPEEREIIRRLPRTESDTKLLGHTSRWAVCTCWSEERLRLALPPYLEAKGWTRDDIRVYSLGSRLV